jgi:CO/xanthine dehydrogenase Mo-binding subunit
MAILNEGYEIGKTAHRADAFAKVTGNEKYAADYYDGAFLWAGVKRAGVPHGTLTGVHTEDAKALPGIVAVLTAGDIPGENKIGLIRRNQPVLVETKIRFCGDPVAVVLAENREALRKALNRITVDYEPLPGVFSVEEALRENSPLIHEDNPEGNVVKAVSVETGAGVGAMAECDVVVEGIFETPSQEHAYLETEAGWAYRGEDGTYVIVAATQTPFRDCFEIAPVLGVDPGLIRVIAPYLGGAFGGKDGITVQCLLGLTMLHAGGRPVKMWWDREESFLAGVKRMSAKMHYRLGVKQDGTFHSLECRLYYDGGAYSPLGGEIMTLGVEHAGGAYRIPNVDIKGWCVYTNNPVGGPFRGFGVPQVTAAMEQAVDMAAQRLGMDPLAIRLKNAVRKGDRNCLGVTLTNSTGATECLETLSRHPLWKGREAWKAGARPFKARGAGVACMAHAMGYPPMVADQANAKIELTTEGNIRVYAGVVDMGQGNASTYVQIAGHMLGQDSSSMELVLPDTARTLPSGSSSASRTTYTYGNALIEAVGALRNMILEIASRRIGGSGKNEIALLPGRARHVPTGIEFTFRELAASMDESARTFTGYFKMPVAEEKLDVIYMGPHLIFSYGAHLVYVEVDELTGAVDVLSYLAVTDAGRVMNPGVYTQQIEGAVAQGIGYAVSEDFKTTDGRIVTKDLATYIIPTSMDIPPIESIAVEIPEETGPFGLKGAGEIGMSGPLPAIGNAIRDACGTRVFRAPFTGEAVYQALTSHKQEEYGP